MTTSTKEARGWNIYQRGDGQHVLQYRVTAGVWKETRIPREHRTERAAERWALAWLHEYRKGVGDRPVLAEVDDERPTVRELAEKWLELVDANPKLSPGTRAQHRSCMLRHVLAYREVADVPIPDLGPAGLRAWVRRVRDDGKLTITWKDAPDGKRVRSTVRGGPLAPFTCRNIVNTLTAFFADCMAEEWVDLPANPMKHEAVRREIPEGVTLAGKHTIIHLTKPVAERLLTCPGVPEWRRVRTLHEVTSGLAEGEVSGLRWDDVDLDATPPVARVTKALAKCGKDGWATLSKTKTPNRVRVVPLHTATVRALRAWKASGWARHVGRQPGPTDFLYPSDKGEAWRPSMATMLRADLRLAGLPDTYEGHNFTAHATRRTFLTWLAEAGVEKGLRDRLVGHAADNVGDGHYTNRTLVALAAAVESIKLDLSTGEVVQLPVRMVAGGEPMGSSEPSTDGPQAGTLAALLTADRGKPAVRGDGIGNDSRHRGTNSVGRVPASQAGCRGFESRVPLRKSTASSSRRPPGEGGRPRPALTRARGFHRPLVAALPSARRASRGPRGVTPLPQAIPRRGGGFASLPEGLASLPEGLASLPEGLASLPEGSLTPTIPTEIRMQTTPPLRLRRRCVRLASASFTISTLKWTPIFGPGVKMVRGACSRTERSRTNEEYTQEVLTGIQGEGGARGVAGRRDGAGSGEAVRRAPEPDPRMEAGVLRERVAKVFLARRAVGNERQQRSARTSC